MSTIQILKIGTEPTATALESESQLLQYIKQVSCHATQVGVRCVWGVMVHHWAAPQTVNTLVYQIETDYGCVFAYVCACTRVCSLMRQSFDLQPVFCCF